MDCSDLVPDSAPLLWCALTAVAGLAVVAAGLNELFKGWYDARSEVDGEARRFVLSLQYAQPIWERDFRLALRWAARRKNRAVVRMVLSGELLASIDKDGWIYVRPPGECAVPRGLTAEDLEMVEKRVLRY